ncbi:hypothetical protein PsorP6_013726 [Peronosclerospora sorghi]|uniref:Uncharacterized protein n=1 Tax=Peronosclerospora sorghi TaxID=230839 RepID=A0ACC0VGE9_9STRA|nr:hypothetical protein PsorP6_013726 [Peronosclerospora sorghi]
MDMPILLLTEFAAGSREWHLSTSRESAHSGFLICSFVRDELQDVCIFAVRKQVPAEEGMGDLARQFSKLEEQERSPSKGVIEVIEKQANVRNAQQD